MNRERSTESWVAGDKQHLWHPFTPMRDWCSPAHEPLVIVSGDGAILRDSRGREYLDGNSSIWTNLHGHNHPRINAAIAGQLGAFAHCSFLGLTHPLAIQLAGELVALYPVNTLTRVFYSDDGSTAIEAALRMARQFWVQSSQPHRQRYLAFDRAYHGDTMGAASLGGIPMFHGMAPGYDQALVQRIAGVDDLDNVDATDIAAAIIEPLIQGAAGMRLWPAGTLRTLRQWCDRTGVLLIADEVMTGFGRTGTMFACEREGVLPDLMCLAKGLTGGYLPMAATLSTERIFEAFLGDVSERKTFYYGHSYTGSALGCAAALASLAIFRDEGTLSRLQAQIALMTELMRDHLAPLPQVIEIRQCGFIAGIEVQPGLALQTCVAARDYGLLARPIADTIALMPPYCTTDEQLTRAVKALASTLTRTPLPHCQPAGAPCG